MKKTTALVLAIIALLVVAGCSNSTDPATTPLSLTIRDCYADVDAAPDGQALLSMQGVIENTHEMKTAQISDLPQLTMDGEVIEATYDAIDMEDASKVDPGKSVVFTVQYTFDPSVDHEWHFEEVDDTVVEGLDEYVCIKQALRNFEGKPQVTEEEMAQVEREAQERFEEFQKEEAAKAETK